MHRTAVIASPRRDMLATVSIPHHYPAGVPARIPVVRPMHETLKGAISRFSWIVWIGEALKRLVVPSRPYDTEACSFRKHIR